MSDANANGHKLPPEYVPGTIGIPSGELGRYVDFYMSVHATDIPPGTQVAWARGTSIAENCNMCAEKMTGDWLWIVGDDHVWKPGALKQLLKRELDIVVAHGLVRRPPYNHVCYKGWGEDDEGNTIGVLYDELPPSGLVKVVATGSAGMLIRRHVLEAMEKPWFATVGAIQNEDIYFCIQAAKAGFDIYVDLDVPFGHVATNTVYPTYNEDKGEWSVGLDLGGGQGVTIDLVREKQHA